MAALESDPDPKWSSACEKCQDPALGDKILIDSVESLVMKTEDTLVYWRSFFRLSTSVTVRLQMNYQLLAHWFPRRCGGH